jgi:hypothetical protein
VLYTGELSALEDIVTLMISHQPQSLLKPIVLKAMWWLCERAHQAALSEVSRPALVSEAIPLLLQSAEVMPVIEPYHAIFHESAEQMDNSCTPLTRSIYGLDSTRLSNSDIPDHCCCCCVHRRQSKLLRDK